MPKDKVIRSLTLRPEDAVDSADRLDLVPRWVFKHAELAESLKEGTRVSREQLLNLLNHIHFVDGHLLVHLRHIRYGDSVILKAKPQPCLGNSLQCRWLGELSSGMDLEAYRLCDLLVDDGRSMILVPLDGGGLGKEGISVTLPEGAYVVGQRRVRRYRSSGISAEVIQAGFRANGVLVDFSPTELAVRVRPEEDSSFLWFRQDEPVTLWLQDESHTVFSGTCKCIREGDEGERKVLVLQPGEQRIQRYPVRRIRNPRRQLVPSPSLAFEHPLLKRWIQLEVSNLSSSGFCVKEARDEAVLMPGLILPEVNIQVADALQLRCKAQVIYSFPETQETLRCGLAILDMEIADYTRLSHLIASAVDPHAFLSCQVDLDALWEFFFEAGFIYPKKYSLIHAHKEEFKKTYQKLYMDSPSIARHFTCQRNGRIYGHIAMVRAYERSWMIHHHAARSSEGRRAGFLVLTHLMHYINDIHRFPSIDMRYVMSYFRPENRFPKEVFGGFSETLKDPQGCSQDLFAYLPHTSLSLERGLPEPWSLRGSLEKDLVELNHFYRYRSGGLLLEAMNLGREGSRGESLFELYKEEGFFRKRSCYSLCHGDQARAIFVLDQSDLGLNLSELLNSIKIFILEQEEVPWNILSMAIGPMTKLYRIQKVPIMFYPAEYMVLHRLPYEKTYEAWVLDVQHGNAYMEYMQKRFRVGYGEQGGQK